MKSVTVPLRETKRLKGSEEMHMRSKGFISAPSRHVGSPTALKALLINTINSSTLKSTLRSPMFRQSSLGPRKMKREQTKKT
jgi:hypothetical protein